VRKPVDDGADETAAAAALEVEGVGSEQGDELRQ
jgi:hypothetical protein